MPESEIVRILQQIREEEDSARRALYDQKIVAKHTFINKRTENIGGHVKALAHLVGSEERAIALVVADQMQTEHHLTRGERR
jgi:hypothetical protein